MDINSNQKKKKKKRCGSTLQRDRSAEKHSEAQGDHVIERSTLPHHRKKVSCLHRMSKTISCLYRFRLGPSVLGICSKSLSHRLRCNDSVLARFKPKLVLLIGVPDTDADATRWTINGPHLLFQLVWSADSKELPSTALGETATDGQI
jgi:hypothetical protein